MVRPFQRDRWRDTTRENDPPLPDLPIQLPGDPTASAPGITSTHASIEVNVPARTDVIEDQPNELPEPASELRTVTVTVDGPDDRRLLIYDRSKRTAWIRSSATADIAKANGPCPPSEPSLEYP